MKELRKIRCRIGVTINGRERFVIPLPPARVLLRELHRGRAVVEVQGLGRWTTILGALLPAAKVLGLLARLFRWEVNIKAVMSR